MQKQEIQFRGNKSLCVFPEDRRHLPQALTELDLADGRPVIVLIGGYIPDANADATQQAIETIATYAEENKVLIVCGGTVVGIMGLIGQMRLTHGYQFPLLGITLKILPPRLKVREAIVSFGGEKNAGRLHLDIRTLSLFQVTSSARTRHGL